MSRIARAAVQVPITPRVSRVSGVSGLAFSTNNSRYVNPVIETCKQYTMFSWIAQKNANPIHIKKAKGIYFWDETGKRYTDLNSQLVCSNIGHGHPKMIAAIQEQAAKLAYAAPATVTDVRAELGPMLAKYTPGNLNKFVFTTGGAEVNEMAIRIARNYTGRHKIMSRYRSYHGSTLATSMLTGEPRRWDNEHGTGFIKVFDPYKYRSHLYDENDTDEMFSNKCLKQLEETLIYENPESVAAIFLETVTGTNGIIVPPDGYLKDVRELCDKYGILMVCDEIMCGMGRTGEWFGVDHWNVVPDMLSMAKGITSAYMPLGALALGPKIAGYYDEVPFKSGATYQNHPMCLAAGIANIKIMEEEDIVGNSRRMGALMSKHLQKLKEKHPSVGDVRSIGLFGCIELVKNRKTKAPMAKFNETSEPMMKLNSYLREKGIYAMIHWDMLHTNPPLCITEEELDEIFEVLDKALYIVDEYYEA